jgi:serralysin
MAVQVTNITATGNDYVDGVSSNSIWGDSVALNITYSTPSSGSFYEVPYSPANEPTTGFSEFSTTQKNFLDNFLARLTAYYVPITFTKVTESSSVHAILRYANSTVADPAHGYYPSHVTLVTEGGDAWIDPNVGDLGNPAYGNYAGFNHMHEVFHTIGLKHAHETTPTGVKVPSDKDQVEFTIMSYREYENSTAGDGFEIATGNFPPTPMTLDIQVLHRMYGSVAPGSGDIEYHFNPTNGAFSRNGVVQITPPVNILFMTQPPERTSGVITWDCSDYTTDLDVNLAPGEGSVFADAQLASLASGVDAQANVYVPVMYGGETDAMPTRVKVGSGNNTVIGNSKTNTIVLSGARADYTAVDHGDGTYTITKTADSKTNVIYAIEFVEFSDETVAVGDLDETPPGPGHTDIVFTVTA